MVMQRCVRGEMKTRNWQSVSSCRADLSCPHIGKYTRNGGRICVFGYGNMHFGNVRIRAR